MGKIIQIELELSVDRQEGVSASKELIAEEIEDIIKSLDPIEAGEIEFQILETSYRGSGKGKPLRFLINFESPDEEPDDEALDLLPEALMELLDGEEVVVQTEVSDSESYFTIMCESSIMEMGERTVL